MRKNCSVCTHWRYTCIDFSPRRAVCRHCVNRRDREMRRNSNDWLEVGPLRAWIEQALKEMSVTKFCETAHMEGRRLWGLRYEAKHVNYYVADRILTLHSGPPLWELYPDADERT